MRPDDDQVRPDFLRSLQGAREGITGRERHVRSDMIDLDDRFGGLLQQFPRRGSLTVDQVNRLVVVDHMNERESGVVLSGDQDGPSQCAIRPGGKICRDQDASHGTTSRDHDLPALDWFRSSGRGEGSIYAADRR